MASFSPVNFYAFAAARGQFLRPDVRALLEGACPGPFSHFADPHDRTLQEEAEALRKRLDALLFPDGLPRPAEAQGTVSPPLVPQRAERRDVVRITRRRP
jgi:hypothetical protein